MKLFLFATLMLFAFPTYADDDPPKTKARICDGPLPSLSLDGSAEDGCYGYDITATGLEHPDYLTHEDDGTFRHVYFNSGDPACIFTADPHGNGVKHVSGGRDINPDERVAYIAEGWHIYGISGKSCSEAGIPLCSGLFCR